MSLDIARVDTICALSSAPGYGAIAIVRASGNRAEEILRAIFRRNNGVEPFVAMHGEIYGDDQRMIDDVVAIFYPSKKGFTGEPSFEIFCHGNQLIIDEILEEICRQGGRLAEPGEFSLRALLNGKIDLAQAESIADLIHAKSKLAKDVALRGVKGGLLKKTEKLREAIIDVLAEMEARMDFPDEDLGHYDRHHLIKIIDDATSNLTDLLKNAQHALKLHEGARIVICGVPNAGKSTLLNRLVGEERAIVHDVAGTTRDVIEANIVLNNIPVVLVDIAGIRPLAEANHVEKIGIERALNELLRAHVIIWLADWQIDEPFGDPLVQEALKDLNTPVLKVLNKIDNAAVSFDDILTISAQTGLRIDHLKQKLAQMLSGDSDSGEIFITRARQRCLLDSARNGLIEARNALASGLVDEVITSELRAAGLAFDRLFGRELSEDVLDRIFSQFCIGK